MLIEHNVWPCDSWSNGLLTLVRNLYSCINSMATQIKLFIQWRRRSSDYSDVTWTRPDSVSAHRPPVTSHLGLLCPGVFWFMAESSALCDLQRHTGRRDGVDWSLGGSPVFGLAPHSSAVCFVLPRRRHLQINQLSGQKEALVSKLWIFSWTTGTQAFWPCFGGRTPISWCLLLNILYNECI